jgi:hypothetical protein
VSVSLPRLRAPRDDGSILAVPPLAQAGALLARNHHDLAAAPVEVLGKPGIELRRLARDGAWDAIRRYLGEGGEPLPDAPQPDQPWLVAGHQPELFHPGVWFKNFALHGLARQHGAFALNLVVDNDVPRPPILHVPADAHRIALPYDRWQGESPYEERTVLDETLFASLPERAAALTHEWPFVPLLSEFWREVLRRRDSTPLLGQRLALARRAFERRWGCGQAELPLSRVCQGEAFAWFACHLALHACRLRDVYNAAVRDYRRRYGIRSTFHPVPDLVCDGEWCELPLWAWRTGQRRRARLFARRQGGAIDLRAGDEAWPTLQSNGDPARLVAQWLDLERRGYKVRTRALTTTLFGRLFLGDLFIHGIGGGKYDELTDALIAQFFGCPVPGYLVLTATLLLPLPRFSVDADQCRHLATLHRDLCYNPQRHLAVPPQAAVEPVHAKAAWIARSCSTHAERRERFLKLRELNELMRPWLQAEEERVRQARDECRDRLRVNDVLGRRDYALCLYPEEMLRRFYQGFFKPAG